MRHIVLPILLFGVCCQVTADSARDSAREMMARFESPLPEGCIVATDDLAFPSVPDGFSRLVRFVEIDGSYRASLSTGELEDYLLAPDKIDPAPDGYDWGTCHARVRFAALADVEDTDEIESTSETTTEPDSDIATTPADRTGPDTTVAATHSRLGTGTTSLCTSPSSGAARKVMVPDVRFLTQYCLDNSVSAAASASAGTELPDCGGWSAIAEGGVPSERATMGIVLPDGSQIRWGLDTALASVFEKADRGPYLGEEYIGPDLAEARFPNGVVLGQEADHGYTALVPVGLLPYWSSSVVPETPVEPLELDLIPLMALDGSAVRDHLYVSDRKSGADSARNSLTISLSLEARNAMGHAVEADACSSRVRYDITTTTLEDFFEISGDTTKELSIGTTHEVRLTLKDLLEPGILEITHNDLFYGAWIEIRATAIDSEGATEPLGTTGFALYRWADASDDEHEGRSIAMMRTLADGAGGVVRSRAVDVRVPPEAAFELSAEPGSEFSFVRDVATMTDGTTDRTMSAFRFDPNPVTGRTRRFDALTLSRDGRTVATIDIEGTAEPRQKIHFNETGLITQLRNIKSDRAGKHAVIEDAGSLPRNEHGNVDWKALSTSDPARFSRIDEQLDVHPALVTEEEVDMLNAAATTAAIKTQMQGLWGDLFDGLEWSSSPADAVQLEWYVRSNRRAFPMGLTPAPVGTDNYDELRRMFEFGAEYNKAETAYRLSERLNQTREQPVWLWPDSILENHAGQGDLSMSLTLDDFVNAMAKTAVHEVGHAFGLSHPVQSEDTGWAEVQLIHLPRDPEFYPVGISFRGEGISVSLDDMEWPGYLKRPAAIGWRLAELPSIGYETYGAQPWNYLGVTMARCTEDSCPGVMPSRLESTYRLVFANHMGTYDQPEFDVSDGTVITVEDGGGHNIVDQRTFGGRCVRAMVRERTEGPDRHTMLSDIMHGGYKDTAGKLRFRSGVSLELMKMALALDYDLDDAEVAARFARYQVEDFALFGGRDFRPEEPAGPFDLCATVPIINSQTGDFLPAISPR